VSLNGSRPRAGNLDACGQPALASTVEIGWTCATRNVLNCLAAAGDCALSAATACE
jgi:hypothetical protein